MCLDLKDSMADVTFTHPGIYAISESFLDDLQIKSHHSFFRQHNANPPVENMQPCQLSSNRARINTVVLS